MGLPNLEINFKEKASSAIQRGDRGIVALILRDTVPTTNPLVLENLSDLPESLTISAENKEQITLTFKGYVNPPKRVICYFISSDEADYTTAESYLETVKWDYIAFPTIKSTETDAFATWIKGCRDNKGIHVKAILPHCVADHEGIINLDTDDNKVGNKTYTAAQYCARVAGIIAGTPLSISATYAVLPELDDVPHHTRTEFDTLIDDGKLVFMNDGEKVKIARAVNSLTTTNSEKGNSFKKIKIVDILDLIHSDIEKTISDNYIGKYPNDYDHKCILIVAIKAYIEELENEMILDKGKNSIEIDVDAQRAYLRSIGQDVDNMKEQEIKEANTGSSVFLKGTIKPLDAIEDVTINFTI